MTKMVLTTKTFIGHGAAGRLAYPGEEVDVDEKGVAVAAGSTPIGNMTTEMLKAELAHREKLEGKSKSEPNFGSNVEKPGESNTGRQALQMANFRPAGDGLNPQGVPPGTVPVGDNYIRPAAESADVAVEVVVGSDPAQAAIVDGAAFDHDADGKVGGSKAKAKK